MKFSDLVDSKDNLIGEIIEFDDGVCILKLCIIRKVYCFDNPNKLQNYIFNSLRLKDIKIITNGLIDHDSDNED